MHFNYTKTKEEEKRHVLNFFFRLPMNERVKVLTLLRLDMNKPYIHKWPEVLNKQGLL